MDNAALEKEQVEELEKLSEKSGKAEISEMTAEDITDVLRIAEDNNLAGWTSEAYLAEITNESSISMVLQNSGKLAGFIMARLIMTGTNNDPRNCFEILNIAVDKSLQNRGLGQTLLDDFLYRAGVLQAYEVYLEVRKSNFKAIAFYEKNGFAKEFERKNYYTNPPEDAIIMRLKLN